MSKELEALEELYMLATMNDDTKRGMSSHRMANDANNIIKQALTEQEKKGELLNKIKDILALNFSYQEIGIKIKRLFKEEMK